MRANAPRAISGSTNSGKHCFENKTCARDGVTSAIITRTASGSCTATLMRLLRIVCTTDRPAAAKRNASSEAPEWSSPRRRRTEVQGHAVPHLLAPRFVYVHDEVNRKIRRLVGRVKHWRVHQSKSQRTARDQLSSRSSLT